MPVAEHPICAESERLIDNGVVVVAAAGNLGYQHNLVGGQAPDNYSAFSITDPGNAERVITVGSTHRYAPSTYGVSYFSSRGPTGDGRFKPDLVAPGERINGPLPKCAVGLSGRNQHGRAARQRRGGDVDGPIPGADREARQGQADPLRERDRSRPGTQLPGPAACSTFFVHYRVSEAKHYGREHLQPRSPAGEKGDCLLLHYGTSDEPALALIDGGPGGVYKPFLKPRLEALRDERGLSEAQSLPVDLCMLSHIDDDHVVGLVG